MKFFGSLLAGLNAAFAFMWIMTNFEIAAEAMAGIPYKPSPITSPKVFALMLFACLALLVANTIYAIIHTLKMDQNGK